MEVSGQLNAPAALPPGKVPPRYPLDRRLGGPQSRSGRRGEEKILDPTGTPQTPSPVSRYTDYAIPCRAALFRICSYIYIAHIVNTVLLAVCSILVSFNKGIETMCLYVVV
jgi:hypothetical protein